MGVISTSQPPTGDGNTGYRRQAEFLSGERKKYVRTLLPPARLNFLRREGTPSPDVRGSLPFLKGGLRITPPLFRTFLFLSLHIPPESVPTTTLRSNNSLKREGGEESWHFLEHQRRNGSTYTRSLFYGPGLLTSAAMSFLVLPHQVQQHKRSTTKKLNK